MTSPTPDDARCFWLFASFARSKIKLVPKNVSLILQSILGGVASDFAVVEVKDWIFKFSVFSREVGILIYNLKVVSDASFKVAFHLWNEKGLALSESFISSSLGTNFHWIEFKHKKVKQSYADAVRQSSPPLTGANRVPLQQSQTFALKSSSSVFSRLNSHDLLHNLSNHDHVFRKNSDRRNSSPTLIAGQCNSSLNLDLNLNISGLAHDNSRKSGPAWNTKPTMACSRCLSYKHSRPNCKNRVRCAHCFRLGHIALHCRFPPRFPGLPLTGPLPTFSQAGENLNETGTWFRNPQPMTVGPTNHSPPCFPTFESFASAILGATRNVPSSSSPWNAPASSPPGNPAGNQRSPSHPEHNHSSTHPPSSTATPSTVPFPQTKETPIQATVTLPSRRSQTS